MAPTFDKEVNLSFNDDLLDAFIREVPCLRRLLGYLRDLVGARCAAVIALDANKKPNAVIYFPISQREAFEDPGVCEALNNLHGTSARWKFFRGTPMKHRNLLVIKVPSLHSHESPTDGLFVCLVDLLLVGFPGETDVSNPAELAPAAGLIYPWARRLMHARSQMEKACTRAIKPPNHPRVHKDWDAIRKDFEGICSGAKLSRRMMSLPEMLQISRAAYRLLHSVGLGLDRNRNKREPDPAKVLSENLGKNFEEWHCCAPPSWPPDRCPNKPDVRLAVALLYWSGWLDPSPAELGKARRQGTQRVRTHRPPTMLWRDYEEGASSLGPSLEELRNLSLKAFVPQSDLLAKSLYVFFFARFLESKTLSDLHQISSGLSDEELANSLSNIARTAHHHLGGVPLDNGTIEALIFLVSEYAHRGLGVPSRIDLRSHLLHAIREEPALHVLRSFHRDHFFHAVETCFLGHLMLEVEALPRTPLWKIASIILGCPGNRERVLRLWYLAALLHDIGYSIDTLKAIRGQLGFFRKAFPLKAFEEDLASVVDRLSTRIKEEDFERPFVGGNAGEDHGIIAACHLRGLLRSIAKDDPSVKIEDYEPAIRAIAAHHSRQFTVSFAEDPLAFLLILCDTIQEWNRPRLEFATGPSAILAWMLERGHRETALRGPLKKAWVNLSGDGKNGWFSLDGKPRPGTLCFNLTYGDEINRNSGVFNLWLDATYNLQRLDFKRFDLDIDITFITPQLPSHHTINTPEFPAEQGRQPQMHRLRNAARETHMGFLDRWFPTTPGATAGVMTNGAVSHTLEGDMEHLTLHLRQLSKNKLMTKDIDEFRERLKLWRDYRNDRDFPGDYAPIDCPS